MMKRWTRPYASLLWLIVALGQSSAFAESASDTELPAVGTVVPDVICGRVDALALTYDLLVPVAKPNGATVIFVVSGGWRSVWFPPRMAMVPQWRGMSLLHDLLTDGYHIAIVRHGSAPRYKVPDAADHVEKALRHLREKAAERGLDPERIGAFGFSAGGHLSLVLAMLGGEEATPELRAFRRDSDDTDEFAAPVAAVVVWYPPVDMVRIVGPSDSFPALDFDPELADEVSPLRHVDAGDAPVLIQHGTDDQLVPLIGSRMMLAALEKAGVPAELEIYQDAGHGFDGEDATRSSDLARAWFDRWLLPSSAPETRD
ncbi:MAG: alpha/beta hydrolase [Phycisphaerales bacterium]|jgi:acetyl esterase/lipase|nr:alpha/beta hydrolase [Phycisphaerales bacterium]